MEEGEKINGSDNMTQIDLNEEYAVSVRNAYKSYGSQHVLKGLNLNIPQRSIFALLGPSGCGKTTLLNIIIDQLTLDKGEVTTAVKKCEKIGYMPQDLSLYQEFTIIEILNYYGCLYGMTFQEIDKRAKELLTFLMLPDKGRFIHTLSGGQQRRVSLCLSLVHNPELMVLDEPTVGVDPLLSSSIWEKLIFMAKAESKTIIITTHYIEEAKQADNVGLMRNGILLAEGNPLKIMAAESCETLEQAFLKLSEKQTLGINNNVINRDQPDEKRELSARLRAGHLDPPSLFKSYRVLAQLIKQYYWMKRNIFVLLFVLLLPVIQCSLQYYSFGGDPKGIEIAVINEEHGDCSKYQNNFTGCYNEGLSCAFSSYLTRKGLILVPTEGLEKSKSLVTNTRTWASMHFPVNFSENLLARVNTGRWAEDMSLELGEITLFTDNSDFLISLLTKKKVLEAFLEFLGDLYALCDLPAKLAKIPISFETPIFGEKELNFSESSIPPTVITVAFFLPMAFTAVSILSERLYGQWERTMVSGCSTFEVMAAHIVIQMFVWSVQTVVMIWLEYYIFESPMKGNMFLTVSLLVLTGLGGMFLGSLVAFTSESFTQAFTGLIGTYFITLMLGGTAWPVEGMHKSMKAIYYIIPLALPSEALRAISCRAWGITHPTVYLGFASAFGYLIIFMLATTIVTKLQKMGYKVSMSLV